MRTFHTVPSDVHLEVTAWVIHHKHYNLLCWTVMSVEFNSFLYLQMFIKIFTIGKFFLGIIILCVFLFLYWVHCDLSFWFLYIVSSASLTWAHQGGISRGKYYNLSADKVCTWPVAPLGKAKWLWRFSWYRNNKQQRFVSSVKRLCTNADYYYSFIINITF